MPDKPTFTGVWKPQPHKFLKFFQTASLDHSFSYHPTLYHSQFMLLMAWFIGYNLAPSMLKSVLPLWRNWQNFRCKSKLCLETPAPTLCYKFSLINYLLYQLGTEGNTQKAARCLPIAYESSQKSELNILKREETRCRAT